MERQQLGSKFFEIHLLILINVVFSFATDYFPISAKTSWATRKESIPAGMPA